ncbi:MAG: polysaccharide deacetylase family protein [Gammaproteobacteria bacterium]|nr:polysaccharide deacetylase family protein [Gammaproteobacteria bacterium]
MNWPPRWLLNRLSPGGPEARLHVLLHHRVVAEEQPLVSGLSEAGFAWQLELLMRHFNVLPLAEAVSLYLDGRLPPRAVCVTFDDGFADTLNLAMPIAERAGVPITVFVATRYLNGGIMFNDRVADALRRTRQRSLDLSEIGLGRFDIDGDVSRAQAFQRIVDAIKYRTVEERLALAEAIADRAEVDRPASLMLDDEGLRALHRKGAEIGAHTHGHPILALCDDDEARREIGEGKRRLESILDAPVRLFAYPNGKPERDFTARDVELVREAGFDAAFSTGGGAMPSPPDAFRLPRYTPWDRTEMRYLARLLRYGR